MVDADVSLEQLAEEAARAWDLELQHKWNGWEDLYRCAAPDVYIIVSKNDLETDPNVPFGEYRYNIALWPRLVPQPDEAKDHWKRSRGHAMLEKLKAAGRYRLMLTDDVNSVITEFDPKVDEAR